MNIEELKKKTGMSDAELMSYVLDRSNEGATQEQIIAELVPPEPDYSIGETPWKEYFKKETKKKSDYTLPYGNSTPTDNGWTDLKLGFKNLGNNIKNAFNGTGVNSLWQLGVIDDAFGDGSKLQMWNQNVQAEKARQQQAEYNKALREMEKDNAAKENAAAKALEAREIAVAKAKAHEEGKPAVRKELKELNDKLYELELNPTVNKTAILDIQEEMENIYKDYPELRNSAEWESRKANRIEEARARKVAAEEEQKRISKVQTFIGTLPTVFKTDKDKELVYAKIDANSDMTDEEKSNEKARIRGIVTGETKKKEAVQGAVAGKAGEQTGKAIDAANAKTDLSAYVSNVAKTALTNEKKIKKVLEKAKALGIATYTEADAKRDLGIK